MTTTITKTYKYGDTLGSKFANGKLPTPTRTGYDFRGWYYNKYMDIIAVNESTQIKSEHMTRIYALWTALKYSIVLNANGGRINGQNSTTLSNKEYDTPLGTLPTPTYSNKVFKGWYTQATGGNEIYSTSLVNGNATYYAQWLNYGDELTWLIYDKNRVILGVVPGTEPEKYTRLVENLATGVGAYAFQDDKNIEYFNLNNITSIGDGAFRYCTNLGVNDALNIHASTIGKQAFSHSGVSQISLLPYSTTRIAEQTFKWCENLKSVNFNYLRNLTTVEKEAFQRCTSLEEVILSDSVDELGESAFNKTGAKTIIARGLQANKEKIGKNVFNYNNYLENLVLTGMSRDDAYNLGEEYLWQKEHIYPYCKVSFKDGQYYAVGDGTGSVDGRYLQDYQLLRYNPDTTYITGYGDEFAKTSYTEIVDYGAFGVDDGAFKYTNVMSVDLPFAREILQEAFRESRIHQVNGRDGCSKIGSYSFFGCKDLVEVDLTKYNNLFVDWMNTPSYLLVQDNAFNGCEKLRRFISNILYSIGDYAFYDCSELFFIGNNYYTALPLTYIGNYAFYGCTKLLYIGDTDNHRLSLSYIGDYAFANCFYLAYDIEAWGEIGQHAFENSGISKVVWHHSNEQFEVYPNTFYDCDYLYTVQLPESIGRIGEYAFANCKCLSKLSCPNVSEIDTAAFGGAFNDEYGYQYNPATIDMPNLMHIGSYAFEGCNPNVVSADSINMPRLETIGQGAFTHANANMVNAILNGTSELMYIENYACASLSGSTALSLDFTNCSNLYHIGSYAFAGGLLHGGPCSVKLCAHPISFGEGVFKEAYNLQSIDLSPITASTPERPAPSDAFNLPASIFDHCTKLSNVNVGMVTNIGDYAFYRCCSLSMIDLSNVRTIGYRAFCECYQLAEVLAPNALSIVWDVFDYCHNLEYMDLSSMNMSVVRANAQMWGIGDGIDTGNLEVKCADGYINYKNTIIYTTNGASYAFDATTLPPSSLTDKYGNTLDKSEIYTIQGTRRIGSIASNAFKGCENLVGVQLAPSEYMNSKLSTINERAFEGCINLQTITPTSTITTIGDYAFFNCQTLGSFDARNVTSVGQASFDNCVRLEKIEMPKVLQLSSLAFNNCLGLNEVVLSDDLTTIGSYVFQNCTNLNTLRIMSDKLTSISKTAFSNSKLDYIYFNKNIQSLIESMEGYDQKFGAQASAEIWFQ